MAGEQIYQGRGTGAHQGGHECADPVPLRACHRRRVKPSSLPPPLFPPRSTRGYQHPQRHQDVSLRLAAQWGAANCS